MEGFPNPANEILNIQSNTTEIKFLEIYHIAGHKILETNKNEIDIKTLPPGMYLVRIMDKNQKWTWIDFIKM
ncbi:MAG: T9SS type A sorting domain-containing protein [Saprospiraceae bacterium]|nr:T9SS type A sorting domain-containing protein [Saprospiraceae bacterium]